MLDITIREIKMKAAIRYHLTMIRMAKSKSPQTTSAGGDVKKREPSCTAGGNVN